MRKQRETRLVALAILVSVTLSGLTIWAVARQGRALHDRDVADLAGAALAAATQREGALVAEIQRACDAAARAWLAGGMDELDVWAAEQGNWLLSCVARDGDEWVLLPRTPLEQPLPGPRDPNESKPPSARYDVNATLEYFKRLATDPDPLTRAGALLASAAYERDLGHPLGAARIFGEAAELLRSTPELARFAFRADIGRVEALVRAGEYERARDALAELVDATVRDHPGRLGTDETDQLQKQASALGLGGDVPMVAAILDLSQRSERREKVAEAIRDLLSTKLTNLTLPRTELTFVSGTTATGEPIVIAARQIADQTQLAMVSPVAELLRRYWRRPHGEAAWKVTSADETGETEPLLALGPAFGHMVLVPTAATTARLHAQARWRIGILAATAVGTTGAWALVIWMMVRAVARQRQLAHLQSRFVADVSHELKTPLALIRLLSETLAEGRVRDPERARSYHETITRESERLSTLLDNILDLGRIESGRKRYEFSECDVSQVARQAWALYEPQFVNDGFEARLEIADDLPVVRADAAALQQVLVNLLQNAYRYAGDGQYVRLAVQRDGRLIVMTVEDHGIGMSRGQLDRLGESFFRADDTRVRQQRGAGLGLAIVNHIVRAHHGRMEVQSRPGEGSTFAVWFPIQPLEEE